MKLVVDANILVGELLRERGRELLQNETLDLFLARAAWSEAKHELGKRVAIIAERGILQQSTTEDMITTATQVIDSKITIISEADYQHLADEAQRRIPRDPDDWHTVALALLIGAAIWTQDNDFLGCGVATWTTDTLRQKLTSTD